MHLPFRNPVVYAILTAVFFGSGAPFAKALLGSVPPMMLSFLLYLGSGLGLGAYLLLRRLFGAVRNKEEATLRRGDLKWLAGVIIFGGFLAPLVLMTSLVQTPSATAALLLNFEAVVTTFTAVLLFHEEVGRRVSIALLLITSSCILLTWDPRALLGFSIPALGILAACAFWSMDNNCARNISSRDPILIIVIKGLIGSLLSLSAALAFGESLPAWGTIPYALILGFLCYGGLTSVFFILALRGIGTSRSASFLAISPLFGVSISFLFETAVPAGLIFAGPVMAAGVWLLLSERHTHSHRHPDEVHEHRHRHDDLHHLHTHAPDDPPIRPSGEHSHFHVHEEIIHDHPHLPDIHHRH